MSRPEGTSHAEALFVSHLDTIERVIAFVCARHHVAAPEADDFAGHVKLKLIEDDYAVIRKFEGRSSLRTFLTVVVQRLFLDYRVSAWGKWRPSAEAKRGGAIAVLFEQLTVRDGYSFDEACELMASRHGVTAGRNELERISARLPARAKRRFEADDVLADVPAPGDGPEALAAERDRQVLAERTGAALRRAIAACGTQDRLILTLRFEDGRAISEIAAMLHLDQKGLYRRLERLLRDLRKSLTSEGIEGTSVLEIFESPAVSVEWKDDAARRTPRTGPSMSAGGRR